MVSTNRLEHLSQQEGLIQWVFITSYLTRDARMIEMHVREISQSMVDEDFTLSAEKKSKTVVGGPSEERTLHSKDFAVPD